MEIFIAGGAVRDILMGYKPKDIDYVVVGSNHDEMISKGFKQVGIDFPVYLHPSTGDEYALARVERKTATGYNGFSCETMGVTLIQDLSRRDLTINSMAIRLENWEEFQHTRNPKFVIDPFNGQVDLILEVLSHTSEAFCEDPIRVLRTARFSARYNFVVSIETKKLMRKIVHELNHVPHDRIWIEFQKGLMENHAYKMIEVLRDVHAFNVDIMKPFYRNEIVWNNQNRCNLLAHAEHIIHLPSRFALISADFEPEEFKTHRIPVDCVKMSNVIDKFGAILSSFHKLTATMRLQAIMELKATQRPEFIRHVMNVVDVIYGTQDNCAREQLFQDLQAISTVDAAAIASECQKGSEVKEKLWIARLEAMNIADELAKTQEEILKPVSSPIYDDRWVYECDSMLDPYYQGE